MTEELNRKYDVVSMMITMHSVLYHRFKIRASIGSTIFLISSIVLNTAVFTDFQKLGLESLTTEEVNWIINITSFIILLLSVLFLAIDWLKRSANHEMAVNQLSRLLSEIRRVSAIQEIDVKKAQIEILNRLYDQTFEPLPKVNDSEFNRLKAKHYYKKELSKFIDLNKGRPYFVIRFLFFWQRTFSQK